MRSKRNIRLILSYDGTDFGGWQRQKNARSAQGELEAALERMHGHGVPTVGAGRTDAGVHAMGQVANFYTDIASIEAGRFLPALNKLMPRDLRVLSASEADFDFHSRYDARLRRYRYFILCSPSPDPMRLRYCHYLRRRPSLKSLNAAAGRILGERDFTSFSSAKDESASPWRCVTESSFRWEGDFLVYEIAANAFLWRMVRSLVGSLLHYEADDAGGAAERVERVLRSRDRTLAGPTASARGLFLWNVEHYPSPTRPGRGDYWCVTAEDEQDAGPRMVPGIGPVGE
ncbi:MAG: tRNA pseudouridine(38-40) synthase TruA [Rectinemataceae bacterium]|jgi:tRNA pseudouridine38-40 synthase